MSATALGVLGPVPPGAHARGSEPPPASAGPKPPAPRVVGQRIYPRLAPVRENLPLLQTAVCVFVGAFPGGDRAWVEELCYDQAVVQLGDRVTFCLHRRRAVRDLDETFLRARGLPRPRAWEGAIVLDRAGEAVGRLETPIRPARLARILRTALRRRSENQTASELWQKAGSPRFHLALGRGIALEDLEPEGWDLAVTVTSPGTSPIRVTLRSERLGPAGRRGAHAAMREIATRRFLRDQLGTEVRESAPPHPSGSAVLWWYQLREPERGARARAEALIRWDGDVVTVSASSLDRPPSSLRDAVWKVAERVRPGPAPDRGGEGGR